MKILLLGIFAIASFSAMAGYECRLKLYQSEDVRKILVDKTILASNKDLVSDILPKFLIEDKDSKLSLQFMMSGWRGEEEATFIVYRGREELSEKASLRSNDRETLWFDSYKLDIDCELKEKGPKSLSLEV